MLVLVVPCVWFEPEETGAEFTRVKWLRLLVGSVEVCWEGRGTAALNSLTDRVRSSPPLPAVAVVVVLLLSRDSR